MKLYRHQREAIKFAAKRDGCCALFHDPGLGKTRTGLEIFKRFRRDEPHLRLLVVCPLSLVNAAWGEDIGRFTKFSYSSFKVLTKSKACKVPDIVAINYEALISRKNQPALESLISSYPFMCILDESSRLKNNKSLTTKSLLGLSGKFRHRIVASGTPMPNSELELWGQMRFVNGDTFHKSFYAFRNTWFHLERNGMIREADGRMRSSEMQMAFRAGWKYAITDDRRKALMEEIRPVTHWVKKEDALDLPERVDEVREVTLSAAERRCYREMESMLIAEIDDTLVTAQVALTKLMKLRQVTSGFMYGDNGNPLEIEVGRSSKLSELLNVIEELGPQPVIIWAEFRYEIEAIERQLKAKYGDTSVVTLYSQTADKDESIARFKSGEARFLVANPQSAAHGLTLTNCSAQLFFSLSYSFEQHTQARDRIHRISQTSSCLYIYLVAKETIDEELLKVLKNKQSLQAAVYGIIRKKTKRKSAQDA